MHAFMRAIGTSIHAIGVSLRAIGPPIRRKPPSLPGIDVGIAGRHACIGRARACLRGSEMRVRCRGGRSGRNPAGREIGVTEVTLHDPDPLFADLPPSFPVLTTHSDAVLTAPPHSRVLASNAHTAIQALAYGRRARTVQWHPEFDADVIGHYVRTRAPLIDAELGEGTAARLLREVREVPSGPVIFRNFIRYCIRGD